MTKLFACHFSESTDYETVQNGPIWIMGTPLFYEYEVHYVGASALDTGILTGGASLLSMEG